MEVEQVAKTMLLYVNFMLGGNALMDGREMAAIIGTPKFALPFQKMVIEEEGALKAEDVRISILRCATNPWKRKSAAEGTAAFIT